MNRMSLFGALAAVCLSLPAYAHDDHAPDDDHGHVHAEDVVQAGNLVISGPFARATNPGAPVGGGYFAVTNTGEADDRLIAVEADVSERVEIHEMAHEGDVMTMRELADGLVIPAGETVTLAPGGFHLMFMNLETAFVEGEAVDVVLDFENAGRVPLSLPVAAAGARQAAGDAPCHEAGDEHVH
ncbi:copper chaperone PCu(A)C [Pelagibacterium montanilacus]|uniref:copper chaperone PCu(A)C n=1 Tax=Pelagibacterium montanilacus TaxID=2185280 RepID=UPI001FEC87C8|nr:copper chaperone PCu(A)C [Pelagibacterium montanilacus]